MKKQITWSFTLFIAFALTNIFAVEALQKKTIPITSFTKLQTSSGLNIILTKGNIPKCVIETSALNINDVVVQNTGDKLNIKMKDGIKSKVVGAVNVYITYVSLDEIASSGACNITTDEINSKKLLLSFSGASRGTISVNTDWTSLVCSGASNIMVKGNTQKYNLTCSGASKVNTYNLVANNAEAKISGASNVKINASKALTIDASGASVVSYKNKSGLSLNKNISGASTIKEIK